MRGIARDRARRPVEHDLTYAWAIVEGDGALEHSGGEMATYRAAAEPGLSRIELTVTQGDIVCTAQANRMLKLRYICRLFAKELVLRNFIGIPPDQLLERLLELTLYTEENLR